MKIENHNYRTRRLTANGMILVGCVLLAILVIAWVSSINFIADINTTGESLQAEIDVLQEDLTRISEEVEAWPGVTEIPDETIPPLADPQPTTAPAMTSLGEFKICAYYKGGNGLLTATGVACEDGRTVAVDPNVIPYGTRLYIEGVGERIAEDCGGFRGNVLDLYMTEEAACWEWGVRSREVWVIE